MVQHRLHNVGRGGVLDMKISPTNHVLAAANEDGCVYFFSFDRFSSSSSMIRYEMIALH